MSAASSPGNDRIAVIGLGCLVPGANNPQQLWQNLLDERDATSIVGAEQLGAPLEAFLADHEGQTDRLRWLRGGFVQGFSLDPDGLLSPPERLANLDEQVGWSIEVGRQALRDGGYFGAAPALDRCGLVLGSLSFPTRRSSRLFGSLYSGALSAALGDLLDAPSFRLPDLSGAASSMPEDGLVGGRTAALVAQALGLGGPAFCLDAACASTLYALELAACYLRAGRADLMLAGAVSCADPLAIMTGFTIFKAYPESGGASRPLDRTSGGLIASEGAGLFLLTREADARRDGNRIHATLLGTGLSNDGRGRHPLAPNPKGQQLAFKRAYARAGVAPASVKYVECHATGTPLGDATELGSLERFFGERGGAPLLGSVKSNLGHLLTAAGVPALVKTVRSMHEGAIPATPGVEQPLSGPEGRVGGAGVVRAAVPWPDSPGPRRAAVSAFGFGGTNAHLILERPTDDDARTFEAPASEAPVGPRPFQPLAIVGLGARFGPWENWRSFWRAVSRGQRADSPPPPTRWRGLRGRAPAWPGEGAPPGAYLESFEVDPRRLRTPLADEDRPIPQQLLVLTVADAAIHDAGLSEGANVAVVVAMGTELALHQYRGRLDVAWQLPLALEAAGLAIPPEQLAELERLAKDSLHGAAGVTQYTSFIGNIMATRVAALWDFTGPAFTVSTGARSTARALEIAELLLEPGDVEAVVVAAVDLAGGAESVLLQQRLAALQGLSAAEYRAGEGAGAVVLKPHRRAAQDGNRVYALVESVALGVSGELDSPSPADDLVQVARTALARADVTTGDVDLLELTQATAALPLDTGYRELVAAYASEPRTPLALSSASETVGYAGVASGMASLLTATLALWHRTLPGLPEPGDGLARVTKVGGIALAGEPRPWMAPAGRRPRRAAVAAISADGGAQVVLREPDAGSAAPVALVERTDLCLLPLIADDLDGLLRLVEQAEDRLRSDVSLDAVRQQAIARFRSRATRPHILVLVGWGRSEILGELARARLELADAARDKGAWEGQQGSYYTAHPLGPGAGVAFVYPGGYNAYAGLGRGLFELAPELHDALADRVVDLARPLRAALLYPPEPGPLTRHRLAAADARLHAEPVAPIEAGISFGVLATALLRDRLGLQPSLAFGYSTGESTMLLALGIWPECERSSQTLNDSPLFKTRLVGWLGAARDYLERQGQSFDPDDPWGCYLLGASVDTVTAALEHEPLVELAIVDTPREVVISGEPAACRRVIAAIGCPYLRVPATSVAHTAAARSEYEDLLTLHRQPVDPTVTIPCYSATTMGPLPLDAEAIAHAISELQCRRLDFPRLVDRAYADGARVFVEVGPGNTCTRWIREILGQRPHLACSLNRRGVPDEDMLCRSIARLLAHGIPLDLDALFGPPEPASAVSLAPAVRMRIPVGGPDLVAVITADEQRARYRRVPAPAATTFTSVPQGSRLPDGDMVTPDLLPLGTGIAASVAAASVGPVSVGPTSIAAASMGPVSVEPVTAGAATVAPATVEAASTGSPALPVGAQAPLPAVPEHRALGEIVSQVRAGQIAFLRLRQQQLSQLAQLAQLQVDALAAWRSPDAHAPVSTGANSTCTPAVWDYDDLLAFAGGKIASVFGPEYAAIDTYRRRVRLPLPPYLLVSRVTRIDAERGSFRPCSITTEYDVPPGAWYAVDGQVPLAVAVEAGQCDLLLISYLGIDFENRGERVYRLLDCALTFLDELPSEGDTLRYEITIDSFAQSGDNLLFFFRYECFVGERKILVMDSGCAGFFTDEELERGGGIIQSEPANVADPGTSRRQLEPRLTCQRSTFDRPALERLSAGDLAGVFGASYAQPGRNPSLRLVPPPLLMIDRIVAVDPHGGSSGLGLVIGEQDLQPVDWYFPCHFKDDQVLAGSLMGEDCAQLLQLYLLYLGLQRNTVNARFQPIPGLRQVVRCRGQVTPGATRLRYRLDVTEIGDGPEPYARANVEVSLDGKPIVLFTDLGLRLVDRPLFGERQIQEFATGSIGACFGPDFAIYEGRRTPRTPNGDLQLISRVLEVNGQRGQLAPGATLVAAYDVPRDAWFYRQNAYPAAPYSILMELGLQPCGFLSAYLGSTFAFPALDFRFRNLDGSGRLTRDVDLRGRTVVDRVRLLESTTLEGLIVQKFGFELSTGGAPFYEGDATFGYFTDEALAAQVGLDRGEPSAPWYVGTDGQSARAVEIDLRSARGARLYAATPGKPGYRLAGGQLDLLDRAIVVPDGGRHGLGYVWARRDVDPSSWFYRCHFFQDPVMPGSLGVEAILEAMRVFVLALDLGRSMAAPRFAPVTDHQTGWKYRGQILPGDPELSLEVHVTHREWTERGLTLVGDASLWKGTLRIYEVTGAAIRLVDER